MRIPNGLTLERLTFPNWPTWPWSTLVIGVKLTELTRTELQTIADIALLWGEILATAVDGGLDIDPAYLIVNSQHRHLGTVGYGESDEVGFEFFGHSE